MVSPRTDTSRLPRRYTMQTSSSVEPYRRSPRRRCTCGNPFTSLAMDVPSPRARSTPTSSHGYSGPMIWRLNYASIEAVNTPLLNQRLVTTSGRNPIWPSGDTCCTVSPVHSAIPGTSASNASAPYLYFTMSDFDCGKAKADSKPA